MPTSGSVASGSLDALIGQVADEFLQRQKSGECPDVEEYAARHPEAAELIRNVLRSLKLIEESAGGVGSDGEPLAGTLGDFRLIREVGRGGMGVVYEAEQISLGRRVALKVLPFAATMDPRQLQRFHSEARAAASLEHPHIVPVYGVGCERGVHYFAMKFIDGRTLAQVIAGANAPSAEPTEPYAAGAAADTTPRPAATEAPRDAAYFRRVAEWGAQAAGALDHAHSLGIVHRDVKPGNLLIDGHGKLWVTDFGLARTATEGNLTVSGDLLGTLRYMSPEQALARHGLVDHRTDVYALGATLYELLTGRPAVEGRDRAEILQRLASEEPAPPRRHERAIPVDLQTVVLTALSKDPSERYRSASDLAADLRRFLEDRPIQARPPSPMKRLARLLRRHRAAAVASAAGLLVCLTALACSIGWAARDRAERQARAAWVAEGALEEAELLLRRQRPREAVAAVQQALVFAEQAEGGAALAERARRLQGQAGLALELEEVRLRQANAKDGWFDQDEAAYRDAFAGGGLDVLALGVEEAAGRIRSGPIAWAVVPALDDWLSFERDGATRGRLLAVVRAADPDPFRVRLREAGFQREAQAALARSDRALELPPASLTLLGRRLDSLNVRGEAVALLRRAQQRHPDDFWLNHDLAACLTEQGNEAAEEAVGFYRVAVALRPDSPAAHVNLGNALLAQGKVAEAEACLREAVRLKPGIAEAHYNLGVALWRLGEVAEAAACFREAVRLKPSFAEAHHNLGAALERLGEVAEAAACFREAVRLKPSFAEAHHNLGAALERQGEVAEAEACFREAVRLKPDYAEAHNGLGATLREQGKLAEAAACYREAICLKHDFAEAHHNLGAALERQGEVAEAAACFREAVRLKPDYAEAHNGLGATLREQGKLAEAAACYREAVCLKHDFAEAHRNLGNALALQGKLVKAEACYRQAVRLKPDDALSHCALGSALQDLGKFAQGLRHLYRGHELGSRDPNWPHPSRLWARQARRLVQLDGSLPAVLSGERQPASPREAIEYAELCLLDKRRPAAAALLYRDAFAIGPGPSAAAFDRHRYNAACAAALAGCGQGEDAAGLRPMERLHWRRQALTWLRADLAAWNKALKKDPPNAAPVVTAQMRHWLGDADFAGVRGEAIAKLPEEERDAWRRLWKDVADTLAASQAGPKKAPDKK